MSRAEVDVAVIGAGPYGLTAAVHLRRARVEAQVFGHPMAFWRAMPRGMLLRSNWGASSFVDQRGPLSLNAFVDDTRTEFSQPIPLESFVAYGEWVQQHAVPDVDRRLVVQVESPGRGFRLTLEDGEKLTARRVVVACGIAPFASIPPRFAGLPEGLVSHTSDHGDLSVFTGHRVAVVGGGQSALESAALMSEAGADVKVIVRRPNVIWLRGHAVKQRIGRLGPVVYAPTDVGPLWYSRLVSEPDLFRRLPRSLKDPIAYRCIRPAGSDFVRRRTDLGSLVLGQELIRAEARDGGIALELDGGSRLTVDHLMFGTGFRIDISKYSFLAEELLGLLVRAEGYPVLSRGLESSVPGLHFLGAPAAWSFGPLMRFVSGSWYAGRALAEFVGQNRSVSSWHTEPALPGLASDPQRTGSDEEAGARGPTDGADLSPGSGRPR